MRLDFTVIILPNLGFLELSFDPTVKKLWLFNCKRPALKYTFFHFCHWYTWIFSTSGDMSKRLVIYCLPLWCFTHNKTFVAVSQTMFLSDVSKKNWYQLKLILLALMGITTARKEHCDQWKKLCNHQLSECFYQNPVIVGNHPDPGVLRWETNRNHEQKLKTNSFNFVLKRIPVKDGGGFVLVSTSNYERSSLTGPAFPILHSRNLVDWKLVSFQKIQPTASEIHFCRSLERSCLSSIWVASMGRLRHVGTRNPSG